jgi:hypothetical protein
MSVRDAALILKNASVAYREQLRAAAGYQGQYVFKYDEDDFHYKLAADLTSKKAVVTQSVVYGSDPPEITVLELAVDKDGIVYPFGLGCPSDVFVYSFNDYTCKNARNLKMYFSKKAEDLDGSGAAFFMGVADHNLESYQLFYPCTRT